MISELCHCSNPSTPLEESRCLLEISSKVASRSMGRDRDEDHEVSGRGGDRDANFTQPSLVSGGDLEGDSDFTQPRLEIGQSRQGADRGCL